jgi:hypothetical protein
LQITRTVSQLRPLPSRTAKASKLLSELVRLARVGPKRAVFEQKLGLSPGQKPNLQEVYFQDVFPALRFALSWANSMLGKERINPSLRTTKAS